jgi:hypothetical protein
MALRCKTCRGEYEPLGPDGMPYYHACPPLLTGVVVARGGAVVTVPPQALQAGEVELDRTYGPRPNARDENANPAAGTRGAIKSEGAGTERA